MSEYNPNQESNVDKLKYTVSDTELTSAVEQSERALALTPETELFRRGIQSLPLATQLFTMIEALTVYGSKSMKVYNLRLITP